ncbi:hypothetical protein GCM10009680_14830 [Streptomyces yatensis]|uniref:Uncharacterized protein n=1 Tax=Streptomyces yatensis TaxID=155177 RepID=A0ABN2GSX9_9ACTN
MEPHIDTAAAEAHIDTAAAEPHIDTAPRLFGAHPNRTGLHRGRLGRGLAPARCWEAPPARMTKHPERGDARDALSVREPGP